MTLDTTTSKISKTVTVRNHPGTVHMTVLTVKNKMVIAEKQWHYSPRLDAS